MTPQRKKGELVTCHSQNYWAQEVDGASPMSAPNGQALECTEQPLLCSVSELGPGGSTVVGRPVNVREPQRPRWAKTPDTDPVSIFWMRRNRTIRIVTPLLLLIYMWPVILWERGHPGSHNMRSQRHVTARAAFHACDWLCPHLSSARDTVFHHPYQWRKPQRCSERWRVLGTKWNEEQMTGYCQAVPVLSISKKNYGIPGGRTAIISSILWCFVIAAQRGSDKRPVPPSDRLSPRRLRLPAGPKTVSGEIKNKLKSVKYLQLNFKMIT